MSPLKKILFCVAFGVLVTLVGLEAMVHALHESVDWPFWVFAVVSPAAVTATISIVLVLRSRPMASSLRNCSTCRRIC